jgi:uncharacterized YigZ family protein
MKTPTQQFIQTTEVLASKFIAILMPLESDDNFKDLISSLKKEHKKARHVCYAYRVGMKSKSNDDGEPKGTAGRPLLELLHKRELNNVALIVVRYFGGTKLGAGRLLRTYVQSGINVMNTATYVDIE